VPKSSSVNEMLPTLYDHIEPVAFRIASRASGLEPADAQRQYLVDVAKRIVGNGKCKSETPDGPVPAGIEATLAWVDLLEEHLEEFVSGARTAADIIRQGGGKLWEAFQARDTVCAVYGHGVAQALGPHLEGKHVLELGAGTGGTTRRLARYLRACERFVVTDIRQGFLDRLVADLDGVPVETAILDIDAPDDSIGSFDAIFATNCLHVAKDIPAAMAWLRSRLRPGGVLVLGEGSHYSDDMPSPVSLVLSLFDGWWDAPTTDWGRQPGFLLEEQWLELFEAAGFDRTAADTWADGYRRFGGVYWAFAA
jgi:SAM-dependent methyltransferase